MSRFLEISKGIVEDFLQTAVFLDDRAFFPNENGTNGIAFPSTTEIEDPVTGEITTIPTPQVSEQNEHDLNAKTIIDTFMQKGIICSVLKCELETYESKKENYIRLLKKADIVVLDWDLFGDGGDKIVEIIKNLMTVDVAFFELRSIVIYTANSLNSVIERLVSEGINFSEDEYRSNANLFTTISLFNKRSLNAVPIRTVEFDEVIEKCIQEFTETVYGIVPNVAMAAITEVRNNTHKLLGVLNKDLDPAFLSHRALLETPQEAEKHLEEIIVSEIESIIHQNQIGNKSNFNNIKKSPILNAKKYQNIDFIRCIQQGVENNLASNQEKKFKKDIKNCFTKEWLQNDSAIYSEEKFARLTLLQTNYSEKNIYLTLGVIIKEWKKDKYFLCLQPRCDSTRLKEDTEFIFLELLAEKDSQFDIILPSGQKCIIVYSRKNRKTISFMPENGTISPTKKLYFNSKDKKYQYIGTLKRTQAQRISNEYGAYLSRVGLNESEYLRRNRPKD